MVLGGFRSFHVLVTTITGAFNANQCVVLYQHPVGPWFLTIVPWQLGNFFIEIMCWAPRISQVQSTGPPFYFS